MEIHDLNEKALTDPAWVAFDDGTDTYKTEFNECVENAAEAAVAATDLTQNAVTFTSGDAASPTSWTSVSMLTSGSTLATLFNRISTMVKNVRYLWSLIGSNSFANVASTLSGAIGNNALNTTAKTLSGAINEHESDISTLNSNTAILTDVSLNQLKTQALGSSGSFGAPDGTGVWYMSGVSAQSPTGSATYGMLFQMRSPKSLHPSTESAVYSQLFISVSGDVYTRALNNNAWTTWKKLA